MSGWLQGELPENERIRFEQHVSRCESCRRMLSVLAPDQSQVTSSSSSRIDDAELQDEALPVALGEVVDGKYRVERVLGRGGMGVVVLAQHLLLNKPVVLKFLLAASRQSRDAGARFLREARAAAALESEHVARVLDTGTAADDLAYLVLEYLKGRDLAKLLRDDGPPPVELAVEYVRQAARALELAHARGIVHRDIKPANLFLTQRPDGSPLIKLLDFGVAKAMVNSDVAESGFGLTSRAAVIGSPLYMSPEQLHESAGVDLRTDIWALGVVFYELLTGVTPFAGSSLPAVCTAVVMSTPAQPHERSVRVPRALSQLVMACLEKDPAARPQSMSEFLLALERGEAPRSKARWLGAVASMLVTATLTWLLWPARPELAPISASVASLRERAAAERPAPPPTPAKPAAVPAPESIASASRSPPLPATRAKTAPPAAISASAAPVSDTRRDGLLDRK